MIAIINTGEQDSEGRYRYRLQINQRLISEFWHRRSDGLGECLRHAAEAADVVGQQRLDAMMELIGDTLGDPRWTNEKHQWTNENK